MNTQIPGFTAENSLYNSSERYYAMANVATSNGAGSFSTSISPAAFGHILDTFSYVKKCCKYSPAEHKFVCDDRRVYPGEQCVCNQWGRVECKPPVYHS